MDTMDAVMGWSVRAPDRNWRGGALILPCGDALARPPRLGHNRALFRMTETPNGKDATVMTSSPPPPRPATSPISCIPFTNLRKHEAEGPLVITGGQGIYVQDESGKEYIEALAGLWCASLGFGEERLVEAAARQMRKLPYYHQFASKAHDTAIDLAEQLIGLVPVPMSKVFFNNSGSEANDTAVKLVWYYNNARGRHRKKKIISRLRGYHGITVASASLTGMLTAHRDFDLPLPAMRHADCPDYYRYGQAGRERGGVRHPHGREPRAADPARGPGHRGGLHRRADDGRRRRRSCRRGPISTRCRRS